MPLAPLIAIEGIDGSGKGTQAKLLAESLRAIGKKVSLVSFPRYSGTFFGGIVGQFLNGSYGSLTEVHPMLSAVLYAADRFESKLFLWGEMENNDVVVCDRYVASNLAHQGAKIDDHSLRGKLLDEITKMEYEVFGLPKASLTILLDIPADVAQKNIAKKNQRAYTNKALDIHEADRDYLHLVRGLYLTLAGDRLDWSVNSAVLSEEDGQRPIEEIHAQIHSRVVAHLELLK